MTRPNENCLAGVQCPDCGWTASFTIAATAWFAVTDSGTDTYTDVEWDSRSLVECDGCHLIARGREFGM